MRVEDLQVMNPGHALVCASNYHETVGETAGGLEMKHTRDVRAAWVRLCHEKGIIYVSTKITLDSCFVLIYY
jgi:hypothetical protein